MQITDEMVEALVKSIERQVKKRRGIVLEANSRKVCIDGEFVPKAALQAAFAHKDDEIINLARELWWPHHASRTRETALSELDSGDAGKVVVEFRDIVNIIRAALNKEGQGDE